MKVDLVAFTPYPIELLFATEKFAKTRSGNPYLVNPAAVAEVRSFGYENYDKQNMALFEAACKELGCEKEEYVDIVEKWALTVLDMAIPISEVAQFTFQISDATIAWREQLVRSRVGQSFWVQSGRITDYTGIFEDEAYNIPESIRQDPILYDLWIEHWRNTEFLCDKFSKSGIREEDYREIVGTGAFHRLTWTVNLRALLGTVKHRTCWIAQSHWRSVVTQVVNILTNEVDPLFKFLENKPCEINGAYSGCKYKGVNEERRAGSDPLPVCPRYEQSLRDMR